MVGYNLFLEKMDKLSLEERKTVIKKIFSFNEVKIYTVEIEEGNIVFRVYDGEKYSKITIVFGDVETKKFMKFKFGDISVNCDIFLQNFKDDGEIFSSFVKILLEGDISYFDSFL